MRETNRDLLTRHPGAAVEVPKHDEAVTVTHELLGLGAHSLEQLTDVIEKLKRLQRAPKGPALRQRFGDHHRGIRLVEVQKRGIPLHEKPAPLADVIDVLAAQTHRGWASEAAAPQESGEGMASVEERMYQLGAEELAEQERSVAQLRSRPPAIVAAGAVVPSLLAHAVFAGPHPRGWEVVFVGLGILGGIVLLIATLLMMLPYEMGFSLDVPFTYRWLFNEGILEQPAVDYVLADALHERRLANQTVVDKLTRYLTAAVVALAVEAAGFAVAAALAS